MATATASRQRTNNIDPRKARQAFNLYLSGGRGALSLDQRNALQSSDDSGGGYLVAPEELAEDVLRDISDNIFIRQHARIRTNIAADSIGIAKRTAKVSTYVWAQELSQPTFDTSLKLGKKRLHPHPLVGGIKISNDLLRSPLDAEEEVRTELAEDAGSTMEDAYMTGDGHQKALGVFTASSSGISTARDVSTGNTTTAITYAGLINALFTLPAKYHLGKKDRSGARWAFHPDTVRDIVQLVDGAGQPIFKWAAGPNGENLLLGLPVDQSDRVPNTMTTGQYVGILANWWYYNIADSIGMEIQRITELFAQTNEIAFIHRMRTDGMPIMEEAFVRVKLA